MNSAHYHVVSTSSTTLRSEGPWESFTLTKRKSLTRLFIGFVCFYFYFAFFNKCLPSSPLTVSTSSNCAPHKIQKARHKRPQMTQKLTFSSGILTKPCLAKKLNLESCCVAVVIITQTTQRIQTRPYSLVSSTPSPSQIYKQKVFFQKAVTCQWEKNESIGKKNLKCT